MLTMYDDDENVLAALRAGAYGYTLKGAEPDEIVAASARWRGARRSSAPGIAARMLAHFSRVAASAPFPQLTEREHEVLRLIAGGADNTTVARRLGGQRQDRPQPRLQHHHQAPGRRPRRGDHPRPRRRTGRERARGPLTPCVPGEILAASGQRPVTAGRRLAEPVAMRTVYKVLAYVIAVEVAVQAMVMVFAVAGLGKWVQDGGVFDAAVMESEESPFPEVVGFIVHGINGMMVIPVLALALLISSFFAGSRGACGGPAWSWCSSSCRSPSACSGTACRRLGALHGLNALLLFARRGPAPANGAGCAARHPAPTRRPASPTAA